MTDDLDRVNERTTYVVDLAFRDLAGQPVTPSSASYTVVDIASGQTVRTATGFVPGGSSHTLELTPDDTALLDQASGEEYRAVTVTFIYGAGKHGSGQHIFIVENIAGVP